MMTSLKGFGDRRRLAAAAASVLIIGGGAAIFFWVNLPPVKVSDSVRKAAQFQITLPGKLPQYFKVTAQPVYDSEKKMVLTEIASEEGGKIVLTQQAKPKNIDLKQIDSQESYLTEVGVVHLLKGEKNKKQAIVETGDSWLLIDASSGVRIDEAKQLIRNLKMDKAG